ncbi:uncharacterized protein DDB_G0286299-like isoform X2 [Haliotis rubra]|uniref:uncharacterized protein DDB_G0286299-like isoform X2 n=1 Tax=Haliotis rubra TaxID=36100 RepID=UPI001EE5535B|nr:uncharacterized protein DDB_G0286299-like isoform X2 [Haliotis rubra]
METEIKQEDVGEDILFRSRETSNTSNNTQRTRKYSRKKPAEVDDFIVVKTEDEDVQISSEVKPESEEESGDDAQSKGPSANPRPIASDVDMMGASHIPRERFFHNGKELDLGDMLTTMAGASVPNSQQGSTDSSEEEDKQVEEDTEEEGEEEMEDEEVEEDTEDDEDKESSRKEKNVRTPAKEQKPSSSLNPQTQEENIVELSRKYLTDSQKEIVERLVESNINILKTITTSLEQREEKMSLWRTIAKEVNCEASRKEINPEELRTLWSKHLFLKHVYSRKSMTNESDSRGNVGTTQVFKTLIAKRGAPQKDKKSQDPCIQNAEKGPASKSCDLSEEEERVYDEQIAKFWNVFTACDQQRIMKLKEVWSEITLKVNEVNKGRGRTVRELQRRLTSSLIKQKKSQSVGQQVLVGNNSRETPKTADTPEPPGDVPIKIEIDNAESEQSEILHVVRNRDEETETLPTMETVSVHHLPDHGTGVVGTNSDSSGEEAVTVKEEPLDGSVSQPVTSHLYTDDMGSR